MHDFSTSINKKKCEKLTNDDLATKSAAQEQTSRGFERIGAESSFLQSSNTALKQNSGWPQENTVCTQALNYDVNAKVYREVNEYFRLDCENHRKVEENVAVKNQKGRDVSKDYRVLGQNNVVKKIQDRDFNENGDYLYGKDLRLNDQDYRVAIEDYRVNEQHCRALNEIQGINDQSGVIHSHFNGHIHPINCPNDRDMNVDFRTKNYPMNAQDFRFYSHESRGKSREERTSDPRQDFNGMGTMLGMSNGFFHFANQDSTQVYH